MPTPDLNEVTLFLQVAEHHSLSAAARAIGLPKSTVSRKLSRLEERLGVRLLERSSQKLRLTEAGSTFHEHCAEVLARIAEAEAAVSGLQASPRGRLRVSAGMDFGTWVIGPLVQEFLQLHPLISVELVLSDRTVELVGEGFDVAIRIGPVRESSLVARRLALTAGTLCASPAYLARAGTPRAPEELTSHACIIFSSLPHSEKWTFTGPQGPSTVQITGRLNVNSLQLVREAALAGLGLARLPLFACWQELDEGRLIRVLPEWSTAKRTVHAVYPSRRLPAKARAFVDFLHSRLPHAPGVESPSSEAE